MLERAAVFLLLCVPGNEEGLGFSWFQASTDVSGLVLGGAHRWGYVLSHLGGQRLFKDTRQRFFVLLDHYICYFDTHAPEVRCIVVTVCFRRARSSQNKTALRERSVHCIRTTTKNGVFYLLTCLLFLPLFFGGLGSRAL